mgnify:CR=1 FL=1|tara:strand:+ start:662 stop:901 length:240 start_codon:yes stop_codon:yes gene_type:complete
MHARDIILREQEAIALLMDEKNAAEAKVKQLENENEFLQKRIQAMQSPENLQQNLPHGQPVGGASRHQISNKISRKNEF